MSQHDYDISTADANTGVTMRAAINAALQALAGNNSGATEPATKYPYMWWADTTSGYLKQRNAANTAWITVMLLATALMSDSDKCDGFHASQTPSANQIPVMDSSGNLAIGGSFAGTGASAKLLMNTEDGSDTGSAYVCGGGWPLPSRGGYLEVRGNESASNPGDVTLLSGGSGNIKLWTGGGYERLKIVPAGRCILSGNTNTASLVDDGVNALQVNGPVAAKGLKLDGTASSDVNTLDYYKEGTFTPVLYGLTTAGEGTYTVQTGKYTRIGNTVNITIQLAWSAHTGTGGMGISGLPFASAGNTPLSSWHANLSVGSGKVLGAYTGDGNPYVYLYAMDPTGTSSAPIPMDTTGNLLISGTYFV